MSNYLIELYNKVRTVDEGLEKPVEKQWVDLSIDALNDKVTIASTLKGYMDAIEVIYPKLDQTPYTVNDPLNGLKELQGELTLCLYVSESDPEWDGSLYRTLTVFQDY